MSRLTKRKEKNRKKYFDQEDGKLSSGGVKMMNNGGVRCFKHDILLKMTKCKKKIDVKKVSMTNEELSIIIKLLKERGKIWLI